MAGRKAPDWVIDSYSRPEVAETQEGERFRTGATETVVTVEDDAAQAYYELVVERQPDGERPVVRSLTISGIGGRPVDSTLVTRTPVGWLAAAAESYLSDLEEDTKDVSLSRAREAAAGVRKVPRQKAANPVLAQFAKDWKDTPRTIVTDRDVRISRRETLARQYNVTVHSIDKWARQARDQGLIPAAKIGRHRKEEKPADSKIIEVDNSARRSNPTKTSGRKSGR